jgi:hypothetical protein
MKNLTSRNVPTRNVHMIAPTVAGLLVAAVLGVVATPAMAQHPCEPAAQRLCSQFIPDEQTVANCLRRNIRRVDAACRATLTGGKAAKRAVKKRTQ